VFELGSVAPAFVALQAVTPVVATTPSMQQPRAEMEEYHQVMLQLDPTLVRHNIDGSVEDLVPHRAG
jgi:hypothetical protein